ncbi:MAG TPA: SDR family NAD(P)-dependent oxidoreductase [Acidimicrobiales bacterium]|nr:SDR family NAD(P)-dependent oxidoreductase [Acidimicrobiales bacterium]
MQINGSSALVTGGAGGLGEATVRRLAAAGARVVVADLAKDKGEALVESLGDRAVFVETDATSEESVSKAVDAALSFGPLRIGVVCHGGFGGGGRTLKADGTPHKLDDFRRTIDHYLVGTFNVLRLTAAGISRSEALEDGERGVIVCTASIAGIEGTIGQVAYASAKGGVMGMTLVAARDLAVVGIRVVTIAPGTFITPAYGDNPEAVEAVWGPVVPFPKRMGRPDEYAHLVQQLCENPYLNGNVIRLDGAIRFQPKSPRQ